MIGLEVKGELGTLNRSIKLDSYTIIYVSIHGRKYLMFWSIFLLVN